MEFHEILNKYITLLECTSKELAKLSDFSEATLSRYRSGERTPENPDALVHLSGALEGLAKSKGRTDITKTAVYHEFLACDDIRAGRLRLSRKNLNSLIFAMDISVTKLCREINYDPSTVFRIKNGSRQPSDPRLFARRIAAYTAKLLNDDEGENAKKLSEILDVSEESLKSEKDRTKAIEDWLISDEKDNERVLAFLQKLSEFDLNEYIKAIHFDEMKVPTLPFQLPTSKYYYGLKQMMQSELDFLKATVLSKSTEPVTLYSDMPMTEMAADPDFPKKWMYGMALMLKKGLHLHSVHNIDRPFDEMMLGLESWIPMYMTGQISPYYLKDTQNRVFHHFLRVSGAAALSGEAIVGFHSDGRYYLSKTHEDIVYYNKRAKELIKTAFPLMEIYRESRKSEFEHFLKEDAGVRGVRRGILSAPPLFTASEAFLRAFLKKRDVPKEDEDRILQYSKAQRRAYWELLKTNAITDELFTVSKEEFSKRPVSLELSGLFYEKQLFYSFEEYCEHLKETESFCAENPNYEFSADSANPFSNLQIRIHEGKWALISKSSAPSIHFVIRHPKLLNAIENFVPPVVE